MLTCPTCSHENPEGATLCETCYTPLPVNIKCPNCGNLILSNSTFCGSCGFVIGEEFDEDETGDETEVEYPAKNQEVEPFHEASELEINLLKETQEKTYIEETNLPPPLPNPNPQNVPTQLQSARGILLHVQTNTSIELPYELSIIHIGKENDQIPPDIDVSGFPNSQFVSRIHADILVENDGFYIEDKGSANGTFINHIPLPKGNRHLLKLGDRIALGKEDKVSFIFQVPS